MLPDVLIAGVLLPLTAGMIEIRHRRTSDIILLKVDAPTLRESDLSTRSLRGAALAGSDLRRACLRDADLREADLRRAQLQGADLRGANLKGADLTGATHDSATLWPAGFDPDAAGAARVPDAP